MGILDDKAVADHRRRQRHRRARRRSRRSVEGARLLLCDVNDEPGEARRGRARGAGGSAVYAHCDVTDEAEVEAVVGRAVEELGAARRRLQLRRASSARSATSATPRSRTGSASSTST